jgi:hypothetical protein
VAEWLLHGLLADSVLASHPASGWPEFMLPAAHVLCAATHPPAQFVVYQDLPNSSYMMALQQMVAGGHVACVLLGGGGVGWRMRHLSLHRCLVTSVH